MPHTSRVAPTPPTREKPMHSNKDLRQRKKIFFNLKKISKKLFFFLKNQCAQLPISNPAPKNEELRHTGSCPQTGEWKVNRVCPVWWKAG